jgi:hypothetical protein
MTIAEQAQAAMRRLADSIARSAGQHARAVRKGFERARRLLL